MPFNLNLNQLSLRSTVMELLRFPHFCLESKNDRRSGTPMSPVRKIKTKLQKKRTKSVQLKIESMKSLHNFNFNNLN